MDLSCKNQSHLISGNFTDDVIAKCKDKQQSKNEEILRRNDQILIHSSQCRDANCRQMNCRKMKNVIEHTKHCKKRTTEQQCSLCKSAFSLYCHHGMNCSTSGESCSVAVCWKVKQKMIAQQKTQRSSLPTTGDNEGVNFNSNASFSPTRPVSNSPYVERINNCLDLVSAENIFDQTLIKTFRNTTNNNVMLSPNDSSFNKISNSSHVKNVNITKGKVKNNWSMKYQQELTIGGADMPTTSGNAIPAYHHTSSTLDHPAANISQSTACLSPAANLNQPASALASYPPMTALPGDIRQTASPRDVTASPRDFIANARLPHSDPVIQSRDDQQQPIVGVSANDSSFLLDQNRQRATAPPNGFEKYFNDNANVESDHCLPSSTYSCISYNNSPTIFINNINKMYNVQQQNYFGNVDFSEILYNSNNNSSQNNFQYAFPPAASVVPHFVNSPTSNSTTSARTSSVIVKVPPTTAIETEKITLPLLEIDENEDFTAADFVRSYNFLHDPYEFASSTSSNSGISNSTTDVSSFVALDDDDDDGIEIVAEIKNVEVVAQLPKNDSKGAKRRRYFKETKAVVEAAEEDLTCCICLEPFDNPVLCFDCKKITGCKKCIDGWAHCPSCRGTTGTTIVRGLDKLSAKLREYEGDD